VKAFSLAVVILATTLAAPGQADVTGETDWWRTQGAAVVEFADPALGHVCSLFFYGPKTAAVLTWPRSGDAEIGLYNSDWHFPPDQQVGLAVSIGDTWLGQSTNNTPTDLTAVTNGDHLSIAVQQPLLPLLQNADRITVKVADQDMSVAVASFRLPKLLDAVHRCRTALARR
jgi:hypothetical protein